MKTPASTRLSAGRVLAGLLLGLALSGASAANIGNELVAAAKSGDPGAVQTLIDKGADVNHLEPDGTNALQWAVYHEHEDIVRTLVEAGADVGLANREGVTPLALAAQVGNAAIAELLLQNGAQVDQRLGNGETALMMAARTGDPGTLQVLLDWGADIDAVEDIRGTSALMWAAANRNTEAARLLLASGADHALSSAPMDRPPGGRGPYLAPRARERIKDFYVGSGQAGNFVEVDAENGEDGDLPAVTVSRAELVSRLPPDLVAEFERELAREEAGEVDPRAEKQWGGLTALHLAVREGDLETVKALVEAGADVNQVSEYGWSPLLVATQNRYYRIGEYLLEQGADPNIADEGGWTPLYIATDNRNIEGGDYPVRKPDMDHLEYIKLLLEAGADPNLRMASSTETRTIFTQQWLYEDGATPFLRAAQSSDVELMKLLLQHGADPMIRTADGVTPLMAAAGIGWVEGVTFEWSEDANLETIRMLLDLGLDPNAQDWTDHRTALMGAAHKGRPEVVQMLVDAGARLDTYDIGSRDSLHSLAGKRWQALDYAEGLVRVGVQSAEAHPQTAALIRRLMTERGMEVPPEGRTLDSICVVDICK